MQNVDIDSSARNANRINGSKKPVGWMVRAAFDGCPLIPVNGRQFVLNPLTEQIPATSPELLRDAANWVAEVVDFSKATKIAGEEDKGAVLVAATALLVGLPFGLARWQSSGLQGQIKVPFECEYTSGDLYLNGVESNDRVVIVDDVISTGGTMVSLIQAIRQCGAEIVDVVCVAEKSAYRGVERVQDETGIKIKTLLKLDLSGPTSAILD
ncbi:phosphoribosyltransferase family protein [Mesorhizobium sp. INR15]|uniref:phosphoribosyltransferase family protein n=1 Tax=Mesorhizobium sp. INR15 TaxID=2654248 RepID=UPI0018968FC9|nr:phosphoribosyltransferase family protein [Mesorhizobium sp. INR15]